MSIAAIAWAWLRRKVFHDCDGWRAPPRHVLGHRGLGHSEPEHEQLAMDSEVLPKAGFPGSCVG